MRTIISCTLCLLVLLTSTAMAESINGRLGLTGKAGFIVPLKDLTINGSEIGEHSIGFAGGGGLIYGLGDSFALELDITHSPATDVKIAGSKVGEQQTTDFSLGVQYRIMPSSHLVPYIGAGADFIKGDIENSTIDWSYGGHANIGVDYFLNKSIVLVADLKYVVGTKSDIVLNGATAGKYDPMSFVGTFGFRLFLPENL
jgi:outer membrane protein